MEYLRYKKREALRNEEGYVLSVHQMTEPESVFGQLKNNRGFRRFLVGIVIYFYIKCQQNARLT
jgi:hypothetical protein